jgi:hypothetical protein
VDPPVRAGVTFHRTHEEQAMKYTLKETIGTLRYNGKEYSAGDKVEMNKDEAVKIAHHLVEEVEPGSAEKKEKQKDLDDPDKLK